jgi:hypothetical protein
MLPICAILFVASLSTAAPADADSFDGPPPTFVVIEQVSPAEISYTYVRSKSIQPERTFELEVNGQRRQQRETVTEDVDEQRMARMDFDLLDVIDVDGKKLDRGAAVDRLRRARVVLLALDKRGVHPMYRAVLAKDALILVPKRPPSKPATIAQ